MSRAWAVALSLVTGFVVFQSFADTVDRTHLLLTCAVVTVLAGLVTQRPAAATYLGFAAAVLAISYDPQVVRRSGMVLLALGLVVGWRAAEERRRQVTLLLLALLGVSLLTGALIAPPAVFKEGTALALSYAVLQGANAALHHFPTRHLQLLLMAWGCAASVPMLVHPPGTEARLGPSRSARMPTPWDSWPRWVPWPLCRGRGTPMARPGGGRSP